MKKYILLATLSFITATTVNAQKKKEMLDEIALLRNKVKQTEQQLARSEQREKLTSEKLETSKLQVEEVEKEKQELLKTITGFTSVSKKKADNLTSSLETIKQKDAQLKVVNDALEAAEAEKLKKLTLFRDGLGTIGKVGYQNGVLVIAIPNISLYGDNDKAIALTEAAKTNIKKLGQLLSANPKYQVIIEGNSNAIKFDKKSTSVKDNWDLSALQAATIARALQKDSKIDPKRIETSAKSEYNTSGVETETRIFIKPTFDAFFNLIKENMKK